MHISTGCMKKGTNCAMVGLQGLQSGNAFRCPNVSTSMGLKLFCPRFLKLGRNTKTIVIYLWEVHYGMATHVQHMLGAFAGMSAQTILDHCSGSRAKCDKEHVECMKGLRKPLRERSLCGQKETSWSHGSRHSPEVIRSWMSFYIYCLVKPVNISQFTPWIILDHARFIFEWAFTQSDEPSFLLFIVQWSSHQTIINHFI